MSNNLECKPAVLTKRNFVDRFCLGEFGNMPRTWKTLDEYKQSGFQGMLHIRNRTKGGRTWYDIPSEKLEAIYNRLVDTARANGVNPNTLYISEMGPESHKIFQGEVQRGLWGLDLTWNTQALPMRQVLPNDWYYSQGIIVDSLLRHYLDDLSYQWMAYLLETYHDHVVEFSTYSECWGTIPGYNTVFWEVRAY